MGFCQRCGEISQRPKCLRCYGKIVESATSGHSDAATRKDPWVSRYVDIGFKKPTEKSSVKRMITTDLTPTTHCFTCGIDLREYSEDLLNPRKYGPQQCNECYLQEYGKGQCEDCNQLVLSTGGPFVRYKNKVWHRDCLKCRHCHVLIEDPLVDMAGLPCCNECFAKSGLEINSKPRSLHSVSPRLSRDMTKASPIRTTNSFEKPTESRDQIHSASRDSVSHRHASDSSISDSAKLPRPKPEALYRFIKTTPSSSLSSNSQRSLNVSPFKQSTSNRSSVFANVESASSNTSRSSSVSPSYSNVPSVAEVVPKSSESEQRASAGLTTKRYIPSEQSASLVVETPNGISPSRPANSPSRIPKRESGASSKVAALFDMRKPEAYPPASTSINLAHTLSQSILLNNNKLERPTTKSEAIPKKDYPAKPKHELYPVDSKPVKPQPTRTPVAEGSIASICCKCNDTIRNSWYSLPDGGAIHPECFVCQGCNVQFGDASYTSFNGEFYHKMCIPDLKASRTPKKPDSKINSSQSKSYNCRKCSKAIGESWLSLSDGSKYHPSCFTCALCYKEFDDGTFITKDEAPYHLHCIQRPHCEACKEHINGPYVTRGSLTYHCGCFLCGICKKVIGAEMPFGEMNQMVCCEGCLLLDLNSRTRELNIRGAAAPLYN
ncbi:hypothetical protein K7432_008416 [Basidiobolus ranarum]|uniref:LIM zinc-binding domain-containing protein n=1 Tax=Basidiobolus ranarum TaxID=34480 RepID=A0ABR2VYL3_9FUNG